MRVSSNKCVDDQKNHSPAFLILLLLSWDNKRRAFFCCSSYSRHFVTLQLHSTSQTLVPTTIAERATNALLHEYAPYFNKNQLPIWCYTAANGAVMMRCADFKDHVSSERAYGIWYRCVWVRFSSNIYTRFRWRAALKRSIKTPAKHLPSPTYPSPRKSHLNQFTQSSYNHVGESRKEWVLLNAPFLYVCARMNTSALHLD